MLPQALDDVKVLDLTHYIAGPYCTKLLADYGADVIKVERPAGGDGARGIGPFLKDTPGPEKSGLFAYLNTNKRGITLNLKNSTGRKLFRELVQRADAIVENYSPGVLASLGLDFEKLLEVNPKLVLTSVSNFGQYGPYRDWGASEMIHQALSSLMGSSGLARREPMKMGANVLQFQAGANAAFHALVALQKAELSGEGEHVDLAILEVQANSVDRVSTMLLSYQYTGTNIKRGYRENKGGSVHRCLDGYLNIFPDNEYVPKCLRMVGREDMLEDLMFSNPEAWESPESREVFEALLEPWLLEHSVGEAWTAAQKVHLLSGPLYSADQITQDPSMTGRAYWITSEREGMDVFRHTARPFILNDSPWQLRRPAPTLGGHNREVYCGLLGYSPKELSQLRQMGAV